MDKKKFIIAFVVVFVLLEIMGYLINNVFLMSTYEANKAAFRPMQDIMSKMWIMYITDIIWAFFFVFFFVKGYENKGLGEGIRFGVYMGLFFCLVNAYSAYVVYPVQYSLTFLSFVYGLIEMIILGIAISLIYKPSPAAAAA